MDLASLETAAPPAYRAERRASNRARLRWPLAIRKAGTAQGSPVWSTVTENLSSRGFSCVVEEPLAAGDRLACVVRFPCGRDPQTTQALHCQAEVIWAKTAGDGRLLIGCRVEDFTTLA